VLSANRSTVGSARFVPREEKAPPGVLVVSLKHIRRFHQPVRAGMFDRTGSRAARRGSL
jgi:hypothetical protein